MVSSVVRVAAYRFRTTMSRRWGGYVTLTVLIGLLGGVALGSLAGARRTQSSYSTYLAGINASDLGIFTGFANPSLGSSRGYTPSVAAHIARLPGIRSQESVVGFDGNIAFVSSHLRVGPGAKPPSLEGALGGEYTTQDRVTIVSGRLADPSRPGEAIMNEQAAKELGAHVGSVLRFGLNSDAQEVELNSPTGPSSLPAVKVASVRLVGLVVFPQDVDNNDYNALGTAEVLLTPALTRQLAICCAYYSESAMKLNGGTAHLAAVEAEIVRAAPPGFGSVGGFRTYQPDIAAAKRALGPVSVALAVFGALAGLALMVIVLLVIGRQMRTFGTERETLRALGAAPVVTVTESLVGPVAAAAGGCVLAGGVAVALSPLFPLGPVRSVTPIAAEFDGTVVGLGLAALFVIVVGASVLMAYSQSSQAARARETRPVRSPSRVMTSVAASGLPASAVTGIRFALEPGDRRDPVPVRSALLGAALAAIVVVGAVVFGASLNNLVSHPPLYGWNWNYALISGFSGDEDLPGPQASHLLAHDRYVAASSGVYFVSLRINGQDFPAIGARPGASVTPPLLTGHELQARNQIVLGGETMAILRVHAGETVRVGGARGGRTLPLTVVGTATMPALVGPGMGVGAIVDYHLIPPAIRNAQTSAVPGPNAYLIRTTGTGPAALRSLNQIAHTINLPSSPSPGSAGGVISALRPEEIVDSGSIEAIPAILGGLLAAGAGLALGITLVASVRRRRRDFAVLKTLGLSGRQLAGIVAWQSSVTVVVGIVIGIPLGIVLGHVLWNAFADAIHAVPVPTVPVVTVAAIAVGALVLANVVAAVPARLAARTRTAVLLRTE